MVARIDAAGAQNSVPELLARHARTIHRIIQQRSGMRVLKRTTVDDLYQETVAAALASAESFVYSDDARFLGWISTIARRAIARQLGVPHQALQAVRIRGDESSGAGVATGELSSRRRSPLSSAAMHESENALRDAIKNLPEHYQRVIMLYELEERSLTEVAETMHRTKGATCRLLARARAVLRCELEA